MHRLLPLVVLLDWVGGASGVCLFSRSLRAFFLYYGL